MQDFNFHVDKFKSAISPTCSSSVSRYTSELKDTAPWYIVALLVPIIACGHLLNCLLEVTSLEYLY